MNAARWISLAIAAVFCGYALLLRPSTLVVYAIAYMVVPLAAIWYGDELGSYSTRWGFSRPTPGVMVKLMGWVLLLLAPVAIYTFGLRLQFPVPGPLP
jgi:hypothetical protein